MADSPATTPSVPTRVPVLLPVPVAGPYDYLAPAGRLPAPGSFVRVPLGRREALGVVWDQGSPDGPDLARLRPIAAVLQEPPLPAPLRALVDWLASYTVQSPGAVLRLALSVPEALTPPPPHKAWALSSDVGDLTGLTPKRQQVLAALARASGPLTTAELVREAKVGAAVVTALAQAGRVKAVERAREEPLPWPDSSRPGPDLSPAQAAAAAQLCRPQGFAVTLLEGVTGAGKTEVYFEALAHVLREGRQGVVLLPEIALAAQWPERFAQRFGAPPALWHSQLSPAQRRRTWRAVARGTAPVVVGARSALFLPFPDLATSGWSASRRAGPAEPWGRPPGWRDLRDVTLTNLMWAGPSRWRLWLNDQPLGPEDPLLPHVRVLRVTPGTATLAVSRGPRENAVVVLRPGQTYRVHQDRLDDPGLRH